MLAVALVLAVLARRGPPPVSAPQMSFQLESLGDSVESDGLAISADGRDIVVVGRSERGTRLYHRALDSAGFRAIPGTEGAAPVVTIRPDRSVLFWANRSLHEVRLDGGSPLRFARVGNFPAGMSWDDRAGLVLGMITFSRPTGLSRVARGDTGATAITRLPSRGMHHDPVILPDGEHAAFLNFGDPFGIGVASLTDGNWQAWPLSIRPNRIVGLSGGILFYLADAGLVAVEWDERERRPVGEPMVVPRLPEGVSNAALARDGTLLFATTQEQRYQVVLISAGGRRKPLLPGNSVSQFVPRFDAAGTRVAFRSALDGINDVRVLGLSDGALQPLHLGDRTGSAVAWSRDGRVFANQGAGTSVRRSLVRSRPADGSDSARVVYDSPDVLVTGLDVSRDGRLLALAASPQTVQTSSSRQILITGADSTGATTRLGTGSSDYIAPRFSPDGKWLAYASDETNRYEVYVRSLTGSGAVQVSERGGGQPVWSADGKLLYYRTGSAIMAAELTATRTGGLTVRGHRQVFQGNFLGDESFPYGTWDVAPDGSLLLAEAIGGNVGSPIRVRTGWIPELKALMLARPRAR